MKKLDVRSDWELFDQVELILFYTSTFKHSSIYFLNFQTFLKNCCMLFIFDFDNIFI